jgi:hypothetical protein
MLVNPFTPPLTNDEACEVISPTTLPALNPDGSDIQEGAIPEKLGGNLVSIPCTPGLAPE